MPQPSSTHRRKTLKDSSHAASGTGAAPRRNHCRHASSPGSRRHTFLPAALPFGPEKKSDLRSDFAVFDAEAGATFHVIFAKNRLLMLRAEPRMSGWPPGGSTGLVQSPAAAYPRKVPASARGVAVDASRRPRVRFDDDGTPASTGSPFAGAGRRLTTSARDPFVITARDLPPHPGEAIADVERRGGWGGGTSPYRHTSSDSEDDARNGVNPPDWVPRGGAATDVFEAPGGPRSATVLSGVYVPPADAPAVDRSEAAEKKREQRMLKIAIAIACVVFLALIIWGSVAVARSMKHRKSLETPSPTMPGVVVAPGR